jgi:hypothetical protein
LKTYPPPQITFLRLFGVVEKIVSGRIASGKVATAIRVTTRDGGKADMIC